ncbi:hypothetical protein GGX14DRAFT_542431 [Mycena pura]|uniref:Uncharacterized protein n=1 Tax=Mycena pura TaxID=153505 RepID=A0AAD6VPL3_9AGAR|nr:hypothetical protein GGX14DRAFT_542431 [Mycena pura]
MSIIINTTNGVSTLECLAAAEGVVGLFGTSLRLKHLQDMYSLLTASISPWIRYILCRAKRSQKQHFIEYIHLGNHARETRREREREGREEARDDRGPHVALRMLLPLVAMNACPQRADYYAKLAANRAGAAPASDEKVDRELNSWLAALDAIVTKMDAFYETGDYSKGL